MKFLFVLLAVIGLATCASLHEVSRARRSTDETNAIEYSESTTSEASVAETEVATSETEVATSETAEATTEETTTEGSGDQKCETLAVCYDNDDCNGGQCIGAFLGTCNCNTCLNYWRCSSDEDCGGFKHACSNSTGLCDCIQAFALNGYENYFDGTTKLCNTKTCNKASAKEDCFGLDCQTGRCIC